MDTTPAQPASTPTDAYLVTLCLQGDKEAFAVLTRRYYRPIGGFLVKRGMISGDLEDLVQETFLEAYRSLKSGRRPDHFSAWLFSIAHHCYAKWLRRKRPHLFSPDALPGQIEAPPVANALEEEEEQQKRLAALDNGLAALPEETRRLLELKHRQGKTCEQIAAEWGRPVGTIKSLLSRTYKELRARLSPQCGEVS
jgi:RNA polymerase sigma-70 factor (ECF subfamily)